MKTLLALLSPFAPFLSEELWERLGERGSVRQQPWPVADAAALAHERKTLVVQVDGCLRDRIELPATASADEVRAAALASEGCDARWRPGRARRDLRAGRLANVVRRASRDDLIDGCSRGGRR